jgi:hypothetical protein
MGSPRRSSAGGQAQLCRRAPLAGARVVRAHIDLPDQAVVLVSVVLDTGNQGHGLAEDEVGQDADRLVMAALALLGGVDPDEPNATLALDVDRVTVDDGRRRRRCPTRGGWGVGRHIDIIGYRDAAAVDLAEARRVVREVVLVVADPVPPLSGAAPEWELGVGRGQVGRGRLVVKSAGNCRRAT